MVELQPRKDSAQERVLARILQAITVDEGSIWAFQEQTADKVVMVAIQSKVVS